MLKTVSYCFFNDDVSFILIKRRWRFNLNFFIFFIDPILVSFHQSMVKQHTSFLRLAFIHFTNYNRSGQLTLSPPSTEYMNFTFHLGFQILERPTKLYPHLLFSGDEAVYKVHKFWYQIQQIPPHRFCFQLFHSQHTRQSNGTYR